MLSSKPTQALMHSINANPSPTSCRCLKPSDIHPGASSFKVVARTTLESATMAVGSAAGLMAAGSTTVTMAAGWTAPAALRTAGLVPAAVTTDAGWTAAAGLTNDADRMIGAGSTTAAGWAMVAGWAMAAGWMIVAGFTMATAASPTAAGVRMFVDSATTVGAARVRSSIAVNVGCLSRYRPRAFGFCSDESDTTDFRESGERKMSASSVVAVIL